MGEASGENGRRGKKTSEAFLSEVEQGTRAVAADRFGIKRRIELAKLGFSAIL